MTETTLTDWFSVYKFPGGRRQLALSQMISAAEDRELEDLASHCWAAVEHEKALRDLRRKLATKRKLGADPRLTELDSKIDRTVGAIYRVTGEIASTLTDTPRGKQAQTIIDEAFPNGAAGITLLNYVEQSTEVNSLIELLRGSLAEASEAVGLSPLLDQLATLNEVFADLVAQIPKNEVTSKKVLVDDARGQENLVEAIAIVLGRFHSSSAEDIEARTELLQPVMLQNEQIRLDYRAHRGLQDVDPETGEVTDEVETTTESTTNETSTTDSTTTGTTTGETPTDSTTGGGSTPS